ncbi:hypothetical protein EV182_007022, partial [Spiromyces aspiralis]
MAGTERIELVKDQVFADHDAFVAYVRRYATEHGFNVRLDDVERDKGGIIRKRDIVCSSEGIPRARDSRSGGSDKKKDHSKHEGSDSKDSPRDADSNTANSPRSSATPAPQSFAGGDSLVASSPFSSGVQRRKSMKTGCRWLARASRQSSGVWKIIM